MKARYATGKSLASTVKTPRDGASAQPAAFRRPGFLLRVKMAIGEP
jgi:hypothetical protein